MVIIKKILELTGGDKRHLPGMVILFLFLSLIDVLGIGLIGPFIKLVLNADTQTFAANWLSDFFQKPIDAKATVIISGVGLATYFLVRFFIAIIGNALVVFFTERQRLKLKLVLLNKYMSMSSLSSNERKTGDYIQAIHVLTSNYSDNVLYFILKFVAEAIVFTAIVVMLAFHNTTIILTLGFLLFVAVFSWDKFSRERLKKIGENVNRHSSEALGFLRESFDGYEEIRVLGKTENFITRFQKNSRILSRLKIMGAVYSSVPKYLLEFVILIFVVLIGTFSFLFVSDFMGFVPIIAVFGVAALRLVPSVTLMAHAIVCIRHNSNTVIRLHDDVVTKTAFEAVANKCDSNLKVDSFESLKLDNVSFAYKENGKPVFKDVNIEIQAGESIGVVGQSGSGKSTLASIILGLFDPSTGVVKVNDVPLSQCRQSWQNHIAVIPQKIFLIDASIAANIALEFDLEKIDIEKLEKAITQASLTEFVEAQSEGYLTNVGENGAFLSGGQKQRLIVARAFYHERSFLVMDEATSALDDGTERSIIDEVKALKERITMIVISHRMSNIEHCDHILEIKDANINYI